MLLLYLDRLYRSRRFFWSWGRIARPHAAFTNRCNSFIRTESVAKRAPSCASSPTYFCRFSSCWGMHPSRQRKAISAANRIWDIQ
jgi:hypothetical protein